MTGTREPARSSSATASMFPGVSCPARRCSIPAKGATVASAKDPSPLRYWSRRLHQGIKWRHHPHQVNYNSTATADITLSVLQEQKNLSRQGLPFLCLTLYCLMPFITTALFAFFPPLLNSAAGLWRPSSKQIPQLHMKTENAYKHFKIICNQKLKLMMTKMAIK